MKYNYMDKILGITEVNTDTVTFDIKKFEHEYNLELPEEYKKFMIEYNGGKINKAYYVDENGNEVLSVRNFLSFAKFDGVPGNRFSEFEFWNRDLILEQKQEYDVILPYKKVIMIGWDVGDNSLLISCEEDDYGVIYLLDNSEREKFTIYKVANSFNEFIGGLKHVILLPDPNEREQNLKNAKSTEELAEILEEFRLEDEELRKPIYRELKVEYYDK